MMQSYRHDMPNIGTTYKLVIFFLDLDAHMANPTCFFKTFLVFSITFLVFQYP